MPSHDIFICTYHKDAVWLEYCLKSVQKYARGFRNTIVVYPARDADILRPVCDRFPFVVQKMVEETGDGHLFQNATKTSCDLYSDADFFLHMDSDCLFTEEASPEDYKTDGRCDIVYCPYTELQTSHGGNPVPWQDITSRSIGIPVLVETMRQFPMMYPEWLYSETRKRIEEIHKTTFFKYVMESLPDGPAFKGYSEFNSIGCVAMYLFYNHFNFYYSNSDERLRKLKPAKVKQFWSHTELDFHERRKLDRIVEGWDRKCWG